MPFGVPSMQFPKEERHDIRETFADSLSQCVFDGQTLRLELCSTRLDDAKSTGRRHVVARIVLTPGAQSSCSTPVGNWPTNSSKPEF